MNPPSLRVALIWGRESIRLRCGSPVTVIGAADTRENLPTGEIKLKIGTSRPAKKQTWLWLGSASQNELDSILIQALESHGWATGFWPVGLNPTAGEWAVRDYRLLARPADGETSLHELKTRLRETQPDLQAEIIELSEGQGTGTATIVTADREFEVALPITLEAAGTIIAPEAPVGEGFHWEHTEVLELPPPAWVAIGTDGQLCAGVDLGVEDYLTSVNSSEMPADSPLEFLKSQVVAARSWLLANWGSHHPGEPYTICNGDHCQCYYGLGRIRAASQEAASQTRGVALMYQGRVCDARYAKTCGGVMEPAGNVWAFANEPYLGHFRDLPETPTLDLSEETAFREFQQRNLPEDSCCSPGYAPLTGRLQELSQLYRWQEKATARELSEIIAIKTGITLGEISQFKPLRRGPSGRLIELEIIGSLGRLSLTPELAIRRALSPTHLPSSAFWIEHDGKSISLHGLGWGHGVGLCQIGAAALATKGMDYQRILAHYYRGSELRKIY
jgi:SpoIID/LytB domain protein